jgi:hypothetical protein
MGRPLSGHSPESAFSHDPDPPYAAPLLPHRKVRPSIFHTKRATTIAEVQVDQVHRGSHRGKTADVRYPNSPDVMWYGAPKFRTGQEGFFILHKTSREKVAAKAAPTRDAGDYVALHPVDFQAFDEPGGIRAVLGP